jgi:ParB-like chromosome segregation protein Spo0J
MKDELFDLEFPAEVVASRVAVDVIDVPGAEAFDGREVRALADNIRRVGLMNPPTVVETAGRFVVVVGRRRTAAWKLLAGMDAGAYGEMPCFVRTAASTPSKDAAKLMLSENGQRSFNVLAELASINELVEAGLTPRAIAKSIGQRVAWVQRRLRLNALVPALRAALERGHLRFGVAREAARLTGPQQARLVDALAAKLAASPVALLTFADVTRAASLDAQPLPPALFSPLPPGAALTVAEESLGRLYDVLVDEHGVWRADLDRVALRRILIDAGLTGRDPE